MADDRQRTDGSEGEPDALAPAQTQTSQQLARSASLAISAVAQRVFVFDPKALDIPVVDSSLVDLPWFERVLEVTRYSISRLEFAIASDGWLRGWMLSSLRVLLFLICPIAVLVITLGALVPAFSSLAAITAYAEASARNLFTMLVWITAIVFVLPLLVGLIGTRWKSRRAAQDPRVINQPRSYSSRPVD